jgi:hypothetical protein
LGVFFLFGQTATGQPITEINSLILPRIILKLNVKKVLYNLINKKLTLTIENPTPYRIYFINSVKVNNGNEPFIIGDNDLISISPNKIRALTYDLSNRELKQEFGISIDVIYGENKNSLDRKLSKDISKVPQLEIVDKANLELHSITYNKWYKAFEIELENNGSVDAFADIELNDLFIKGSPTLVTIKSPVLIKAGQSKKAFIRVDLDTLDLKDNEKVNAKLYYGQNKDILYKVKYYHLPLNITYGTTPFIVAAAALVIIIFIVIVLRRQSKKVAST